MKLRPEKDQALQTIIECFTGEDGGVKFALFCGILKDLDQQAINGDKKAEELLMVMVRFSKLIEVTTKLNNETKT